MLRPPAALNLTCQRLPWDALDDAWAAQIPGDDPLTHETYLRDLVASGCATRHRLEVDGKPSGILITRVDQDAAGRRELVLVAAYSESESPLSDRLFAAAEQLARLERCTSLRLHTVRPGLFTFARTRGYRLAEVVMRKTLS